MGTGPISDGSARAIIFASMWNKITAALKGDLVPRNSSGIAEEVAGSLGTSSLPWLKMYLGLAASGLSIEESSGAIIIKVGGVTKARITSAGLDPNYLWSLPKWKTVAFTGNGNFTVPTGVTSVMLSGCGGGGGGGSGAGYGTASGSGGGGGGGGAPVLCYPYAVTPAAVLPVVIGTGGSGGAAPGTSDANGADGSNGGTTTFNTSETFPGGEGGQGGATTHGSVPGYGGRGGNGGARGGIGGGDTKIFGYQRVSSGLYLPEKGDPAKGQGGVGGTNSVAGGGGGGGGSWQAGGAGGNGGNSATSGATGGTGGGGGGGGAHVSSTSGSGGTGGDGVLYVSYVENQ